MQGRARLLLLFFMLLPLFSNIVVRMFAWQVLLSENGILPYCVSRVFSDSWLPKLLYTKRGFLIGLLSYELPIVTLMIYLNMRLVSPEVLAAARNLGASPVQVFVHIVCPFAVPGALVGFFFAFMLTLADFVTVSIVGGRQLTTQWHLHCPKFNSANAIGESGLPCF